MLLNKIVVEEMAVRSKLLEHVAQRIITRCFAEIPSISRIKLAVSKLADFTEGAHFKSLIEDDIRDFNKIERLIFCSGKVYYDLFEERGGRNENKVALIRLEELCRLGNLSYHNESASKKRNKSV